MLSGSFFITFISITGILFFLLVLIMVIKKMTSKRGSSFRINNIDESATTLLVHYNKSYVKESTLKELFSRIKEEITLAITGLVNKKEDVPTVKYYSPECAQKADDGITRNNDAEYSENKKSDLGKEVQAEEEIEISESAENNKKDKKNPKIYTPYLFDNVENLRREYKSIKVLTPLQIQKKEEDKPLSEEETILAENMLGDIVNDFENLDKNKIKARLEYLLNDIKKN